MRPFKKQVTIPIEYLTNFLTFLNVVGLEKEETIIDSTTQDARATIIFGAFIQSAITAAGDKYMIIEDKIYCTHGVFNNDFSGKNQLAVVVNKVKESMDQLGSIDEMLKRDFDK
jgi:hypothetical protein